MSQAPFQKFTAKKKNSVIKEEFRQEKNQTNIQFYKLKDTPITRLELSFYEDKGQGIELNENQLEILSKFLEFEIVQAIPSFDIVFDCEINWEVECEEKCLNFN